MKAKRYHPAFYYQPMAGISSMQGKQLSYRLDIDGLRALAVLAVTIFHFNKQWLPGGFVGVDVFFVLSGYLITGIIYGQGSSFSFGEFYGRRVRRILPAATFVTVATLIAGSFLLLPADVKALSESAIGATLSAANIYFWLFLDTGYFAASSDTVPLLHMWSLGVEEQFYMIWPALMIIAMRLGGKRLLIGTAAVLALSSFVVSEYFLVSDPSFAYYMLPSRAGELLVGALLFLWQDSRRISSTIANLSGATGLALVGGALFFMDEKNGFPGFYSIIPSVGTALLILSGANRSNPLTKVLSNSAARYIGLRSFSLYLWHWPVLAFYRYAYGEPSLKGGVACLAIMWVLTELSYRLIENPFRNKTPQWLLTKAMPVFMTSILILGAGYTLIQNKGLWPTEYGSLYAQKLNKVEENTRSAATYSFNCQMFKNDPKLWDESRCIIGNKLGSPDTLLWGDSHAAHYVGYLKAISEAQGTTIRNISHSACPPVRDLTGLIPDSQAQSCRDFNDRAFAESKKYRTVIIGGAWNIYASWSGLPQIEKTIKELSANGNHIVIALNVPTFGHFDRKCFAKAIRFPAVDCQSTATINSNSESKTNLALIEIANKYPNVSTFSIRDQICSGNTCSAYRDGGPLYFDQGHLSMAGSELLGKSAIESGNVPQAISALTSSSPTVSQNSLQP